MTSTTTDRYWSTIRDTDPVSRAREAELCRAARAGDVAARNELVAVNLRFAVSVAKDYTNQGLTLDELISAANDGMLAAAERFDPDLGHKFITYAVWWVRQRILKELAQAHRIVRLPYNQVVDHTRAERCLARLEQQLGRAPMPSEAQADMGLTDVRWESARAAGRTSRSMDAPVRVDTDDDLPLIDTLVCDTPDPVEAVTADRARTQVDALLAVLPERDQRMMRLRWGLDGAPPATLDVCGESIGVTRERARQIEERALRRMRQHAETYHMVCAVSEVG